MWNFYWVSEEAQLSWSRLCLENRSSWTYILREHCANDQDASHLIAELVRKALASVLAIVTYLVAADGGTSEYGS